MLESGNRPSPRGRGTPSLQGSQLHDGVGVTVENLAIYGRQDGLRRGSINDLTAVRLAPRPVETCDRVAACASLFVTLGLGDATRLKGRCATLTANPAVMGRVLGIVYREIATNLINKAALTQATVETGAVTLSPRFGSALNLNIHFHMLFPDGVYITAEGGR